MRAFALYSAITLGTLLVLDQVLVWTGLLEPPENLGDPEVGWVSGRGTGAPITVECTYPATGMRQSIERNEAGYRSSHTMGDLQNLDDRLEIAVSGDSHTDLCLPNGEMHFGVMEREIIAAGRRAAVFAYGAGRYSPLQAYLAIRDGIESLHPDVLVLNLYTGNDFYDMLRVDDRPHLTEEGDGYTISGPVWYEYDPPGLERRSRVLYALGELSDRVGISNLLIRMRYLVTMARERGSGFPSIARYLLDLRRSTTPEVGYPAAFAAQILNQQLFFFHFAGSADESIRRTRFLLDLIRQRHPDMLLIMSPIPSYQLFDPNEVDRAFLSVLDRLPVTYEDGVRMESQLYSRLAEEALEAGWVFVDNLERLRAYSGPDRLFDDFDYHVTSTANRIIGRAQAEVVLEHASSRR